MLLRLIFCFPRVAKVLAAFTIIIISIAPFIVLARERSTPGPPVTPQIQTVGASIMLRLQREGAPVYDFRQTGQTIPGATRVARKTILQDSPQIVLLGDSDKIHPHAQRLLRRNPKSRVYLVPSSFVAAYPDFKNVRQIEPRAAHRLMQQGAARVFDFAEGEEFSFVRVPGSTRIAWTSVLRNDFSAIKNSKHQSGKPVLLICPVGSRSQIVAQKLKRAGVQVLNVRGGMFAWQNAGLPIEGLSAQRSTPDAK